jgi:hypothetical protein
MTGVEERKRSRRENGLDPFYCSLVTVVK